MKSVTRLAVLVIVAATWGCSALERLSEIHYVHLQYDSFGDAVKEAKVAQQLAWAPDWLPTTATDLQVRYDTDRNATWLRFSVPVPNQMRQLPGLRPVAKPAASDAWLLNDVGKLAWWPKELYRRALTDGAAQMQFDLFVGERKGSRYFGGEVTWREYVAIEKSSGDIFFWRMRPE